MKSIKRKRVNSLLSQRCDRNPKTTLPGSPQMTSALTARGRGNVGCAPVPPAGHEGLTPTRGKTIGYGDEAEGTTRSRTPRRVGSVSNRHGGPDWHPTGCRPLQLLVTTLNKKAVKTAAKCVAQKVTKKAVKHVAKKAGKKRRWGRPPPRARGPPRKLWISYRKGETSRVPTNHGHETTPSTPDPPMPRSQARGETTVTTLPRLGRGRHPRRRPEILRVGLFAIKRGKKEKRQRSCNASDVKSRFYGVWCETPKASNAKPCHTPPTKIRSMPSANWS